MNVRPHFFAVVFLAFGLAPIVAAESVPRTDDTRPALVFPVAHAEFAKQIEQQWEKVFVAKKEQREKVLPLTVFSDRLVELSCSSGDISLFASGFMANMGYGIAGDKSHTCLLAGFDGLLRHKNNPHLTAELVKDYYIGSGGLVEVETEGFYRKLLEGTDNRAVYAGAAFSLARHLDHLANVKPNLAKYISRSSASRKNVVQYTALQTSLVGRDVHSMRIEAARLLKTVIDDYADEKPSKSVRRSYIYLPDQYTLDATGPTYGERAERLLFDMQNLREGCKAPEIVGRDAAGKELRLSDYRGKVVLLMFSFKGCGPCEQMYSVNRKLLRTFEGKPFAVLGVMDKGGQDDSAKSLQDTMKKGHITWQCWWDGDDRKITNRWNVTSWPSPYLIDAQGVIQQYPGTDEKSLEAAITALLKEDG